MPILPFPFVMTDAEKIECWLGFIGISHLVSLKELMLHVGIDDIKMQRWKEISMLHKNKPCVKRQSN
uniref:Uncharacterized protein n=1 Tax=Arundo donax TaxID=35708 RepID=A0A0A8Z9D1_ARUDO